MHAWGGAKKKETWENLYLFFTCLYIDARAHACARIGDTYPFMRACVNMHARMRYTYLFVRVREKTRNVHARSQVIAKKVWMTGSQSLWRGLWRAYRIFPSFFIVFFFPFFIASFFPFLLLKLFHFFFSSCHPFSPFLLRWDGIDKVYRCTKESERERGGGEYFTEILLIMVLTDIDEKQELRTEPSKCITNPLSKVSKSGLFCREIECGDRRGISRFASREIKSPTPRKELLHPSCPPLSSKQLEI